MVHVYDELSCPVDQTFSQKLPGFFVQWSINIKNTNRTGVNWCEVVLFQIFLIS